MFRAATMLTAVVVVTIMTRKLYLEMINEVRYSHFISSGRFLTEEFSKTYK